MSSPQTRAAQTGHTGASCSSRGAQIERGSLLSTQGPGAVLLYCTGGHFPIFLIYSFHLKSSSSLCLGKSSSLSSFRASLATAVVLWCDAR